MAGAFDPFMTRIDHLLGLATTDQLPTIATVDQPDDKTAGSPTGWSHGPFVTPASSPNRPSIAAGSRRLCTANQSPRGFALIRNPNSVAGVFAQSCRAGNASEYPA